MKAQYTDRSMATPEELWRANADKLHKIGAMTGRGADVSAETAAFKAFQAKVQATDGFATSRVNLGFEGYATSRAPGDQTVNQSNSITIYAEGDDILGTIKDGLAPMLRGAAGAIITGAKK